MTLLEPRTRHRRSSLAVVKEIWVPPAPSALDGHTISFGPFRLLSAQRLLLEGDRPVRLGNRQRVLIITFCNPVRLVLVLAPETCSGRRFE